jgi:hypothetical protein
MSKNKTEKEKLIELIEEDNHVIHEVTSTFKDLTKSIVSLDLRLKENDALKDAISLVPDDLADELLPKIITPYKHAHDELERTHVN